MTGHSTAEVGHLDVAGEAVPRTTVAQCSTCVSPFRSMAEAGLLNGNPPASVAASLPEGAGLSARHLAEHARRGHLPALPKAVAARLGSETAPDLQQAAQDALDPTRKWVCFADRVLVRTAQRMASGEIEPTLAEGLAAARLLAQAELMPAPEASTEQDFVLALVAYVESVKAVTDPNTFQEIQKQANRNPTLRALTGRPPLRSA